MCTKHSLSEIVRSERIRAVIFDVDGTLYSLRKMRFFMAVNLFVSLIFKPWRWNEIVLLWIFRRNRELLARHSVKSISIKEYELSFLGRRINSEYSKQIVKKWMYDQPLRYLRICAYKGVVQWIHSLSGSGVKVAYFSDYPPLEKIKKLGLPCDYFVSSSDNEVDSLKPNPRGLLELASRMDVPLSDCLSVGDSKQKDEAAAKKIGMKFLLTHGSQMK